MKSIEKNIEHEPLYVNDNQDLYRKEINLWRAVISQCLDDLHLPPSNRKYIVWQKQAVRWFVEADQDFYTICEYARISPEEVLKYANKIISTK